MAKTCAGGHPNDQARRRWCSECEAERRPMWMKADEMRRSRPPDLVSNIQPPAVIYDTERWCSRCRQVRPLLAFGNRRKLTYCLPCDNNAQFEWKLRRDFGMTVEEYDILLEVQGGKCAICRGVPIRRRLAVDHRHGDEATRNLVHGLLCHDCNYRKLKAFRHDATLLRRAADYLDAPPVFVFANVHAR